MIHISNENSNNSACCESNGNTNSTGKASLSIKFDLIKIYVYQPFIRIRYIRVNAYCPISTLEMIYSPDSIYIFKGEILLMHKTFRDYNITNDNKIVLLPSDFNKSQPEFIQRWIKITEDQETFESKIDIKMRKNGHNEIARINDIRLNQLEAKRKCAMKMYASKIQNETKSLQKTVNDDSSQNKLNIDFNNDKKPSSDILPKIW